MEEAAGDKSVRVIVADTGLGIEPGTEEALFRPFAQAGTGVGHKAGLGLGLALVRGLVESHGGTVEAHSDGSGKGTAFVVTLPLVDSRRRKADEKVHATLPAATSAPRRILVVEDNQDAADSLRRLLQLWGHEVDAVADARGALERARIWHPEVFICDLQLAGDMDGLALARALRSKSGNHRPLLVALTGLGQPDDRERSLAAGFDRHFTKPPDLEALRRLIDALPPPGQA